MNRLKSKVMWAAVAALVISMAIARGLITPTQSVAINDIIANVLNLLVVLGVLNNPTDAEKF